MPTTPNLAIAEMTAGQSNKDVTVNGIGEDLDNKVAGLLTKDCSAAGTITLVRAEWLNAVLKLTGAPGAGFNLVVPINKQLWIVDNTSGQTATVKTPAGTGVAVATGTIRLVRGDGVNIVAADIVAGGGVVTGGGDWTGPSSANTVAKVNGNTPGVAAVANQFVTAIDSSARGTLAQPSFSNLSGAATDAQLAGTKIAFAFSLNGVPTASAYQIVQAPVAFTIPANMATPNSQALLGTAATASTVFTLKQNGSTIGTVTFGIGGTTPTFATSGGTSKSIAVGDVLKLVAPAGPDATAADLTFTLLGTR